MSRPSLPKPRVARRTDRDSLWARLGAPFAWAFRLPERLERWATERFRQSRLISGLVRVIFGIFRALLVPLVVLSRGFHWLVRSIAGWWETREVRYLFYG